MLEGFDQVLLDSVFKLDRDQRQRLEGSLFTWLFTVTRRRAGTDTPEIMDAWRRRFKDLSEQIRFEFVDDKLKVVATGSARDTLAALDHGTSWFDPMNDVVKEIVAMIATQTT